MERYEWRYEYIMILGLYTVNKMCYKSGAQIARSHNTSVLGGRAIRAPQTEHDWEVRLARVA